MDKAPIFIDWKKVSFYLVFSLKVRSRRREMITELKKYVKFHRVYPTHIQIPIDDGWLDVWNIEIGIDPLINHY